MFLFMIQHWMVWDTFTIKHYFLPLYAGNNDEYWVIVWHFCLASTAERSLIGFRKTCFHIDCAVDIRSSIVSVQKGSANTERLRAWKRSRRERQTYACGNRSKSAESAENIYTSCGEG